MLRTQITLTAEERRLLDAEAARTGAHRTIDSADLAIAATVIALDARLLTRNVKRFPMFGDLAAPY